MPESATRLFTLESVRVGVVGNISACHADAPGSIPGRGVFFWCSEAVFRVKTLLQICSIFFLKCATIFFVECATIFF